MHSLIVAHIDRNGSSNVDQQASGLPPGPRPPPPHPPIHAHAPGLSVAVSHSPTTPVGARETHVTMTMHANNARQPCAETRSGNIAGKYRIHAPRQLCCQCRQTVVTNPVQHYVPRATNIVVVQNTPFEPRITNVE